MKYLKPVNRSTKNIKDEFYTFDVETTKLSPMPKNFVFGVVYGWNYCKVIYSVDDFKKEFSSSRYHKKTIFAHNAEFDLTTIFGNIYENVDNSAIFNGKFISAKKDFVTFADSMNIFPTSVSKLGEILGKEKLDNKKISKAKLTKDNITPEDIQYCIRDCEIIYEALLDIFESIGSLKLTIASVAMYEFRKNYLDNVISYNEHTDKFFESYYGGRTEAFKIGKVKAKVYDINSLYPYSMVNCVFPDPRLLKYETKVDIKYFNYILSRYEGAAKVTIEHKETYFGFIPFRDEKSNKLLFPVGTFTTYVNFTELRFALSKNVIKIKKVFEVVYSNKMKSPFKDFVNYKYDERKDSDNDFRKLELKLHMNSLYGKFGMRMKYTTTYHQILPYELIDELKKTGEFHELKMFSAERDDCFIITENKQFKKSFFSIPLFSSYITSHARIELLKSLLENQNNKVVYCDTDSVFLEGDFVGNIGNELGQFKLEDKDVCEVRGLKNYSIYDGSKSKDIIKGVRKGSKKTGKNTFETVQYFKTKESLRRNVEAGDVKKVTKKITNKYDKRIVDSKGNTKPIKL